MVTKQWESGYHDLLDIMNVLSLADHKLQLKLSLLYKLVHGMCYFPSDILCPHTNYSHGTNHSLVIDLETSTLQCSVSWQRSMVSLETQTPCKWRFHQYSNKLAFGTDLAFGMDPVKISYQHSAMREHFVECLENERRMEQFPRSKCSAHTNIRRVATIPVYCTCKKPESLDNTVECESRCFFFLEM